MPSVSGVEVPDEVKKAADDLKKNTKYQYVVFHLKVVGEGKQQKHVWETKSTGDRVPNTEGKNRVNPDVIKPYYEEFVEKELNNEAVFAIYDFDCVHNLSTRVKLVGFQWCPDDYKPKIKMVYAASIEELKKALEMTKPLVANEKDEVTFEIVTGYKG